MQTAQLNLNLVGIEPPKPNHSGLRDPAFTDNKTLPIHRWVPWIAGFAASFVDDVIAVFSPQPRLRNRRPLVLDPFAGVGTTLVQAMMRACHTVGFEINPYAALSARVKAESPFIELAELDRVVDLFTDVSRQCRPGQMQPRTQPPPGFRSRIPFFSPSIERQVLCTLDFINEIGTTEIRDLFRVALASVMVSFSNYSYEPSLGTRPGAGKSLVEDADVAAVLTNKIRDMRSDIQWVQDKIGAQPLSTHHHVFSKDFMTAVKQHLRPRSVDLMITSPPYMNNYHYVRNTRPQLFWLSLVSDIVATKKLEDDSFGKFWQTVRTAPPIEPQFDHPLLLDLVTRLRQTRVENGPYGGSGWANYVTVYFNDCHRFLTALHRTLRPQAVGVIVIGNSIIQGIEFKVDLLLGEFAEAQGFHLEEVRPIRQKRVGSSITQSTVRCGELNGATLYESAVIIRKR